MATIARPIFLLTDFGLRDHYVGQMKAVIAGIAPGCAIHDLTHDVEPFAVDEAAWILDTSMHVLPEDAVVVCVVDPGVGTKRKALVAQRGQQTFLGPDNGVLSAVWCPPDTEPLPAADTPTVSLAGIAGLDVRDLCEPSLLRSRVSKTFHGRDVFAPAAAWIASGADYRRAGPPVSEAVSLGITCGRPGAMGVIEGRVIHTDRFGNLITTIRSHQCFPDFELEVNGHVVARHVGTFADAEPGAVLCHVDSSGYLAVAVNRGDASKQLGVQRGAAVRMRAR